jgi:predicted ribosomally synthesized peptide with nif11-like leader
MSSANITAFFDKARTDETLAGKIQALYAEAAATAQALSALAAEIGISLSPEDLHSSASELSDDALSGVAGGMAGEGMGAIDYVNPPAPERISKYTRDGINPDAIPAPKPPTRGLNRPKFS